MSSTRWTVAVASETDVDVRNYLARQGMSENDFSRFIEESVRWRLLDLTFGEARSAFDDLSPEEMDALIEEAVADTRHS